MEESSCFNTSNLVVASLWFLAARRLMRSSYPLIRFIECTNPLQIVLLLGMNRVFPIWVGTAVISFHCCKLLFLPTGILLTHLFHFLFALTFRCCTQSLRSSEMHVLMRTYERWVDFVLYSAMIMRFLHASICRGEYFLFFLKFLQWLICFPIRF